jgi:hypothetical protein
MSAQTSYIFSEIYLQHTENKSIIDILLQYQKIGYFRYVDDIIYKKTQQTHMTFSIDSII